MQSSLEPARHLYKMCRPTRSSSNTGEIYGKSLQQTRSFHCYCGSIYFLNFYYIFFCIGKSIKEVQKILIRCCVVQRLEIFMIARISTQPFAVNAKLFVIYFFFTSRGSAIRVINSCILTRFLIQTY